MTIQDYIREHKRDDPELEKWLSAYQVLGEAIRMLESRELTSERAARVLGVTVDEFEELYQEWKEEKEP